MGIPGLEDLLTPDADTVTHSEEGSSMIADEVTKTLSFPANLKTKTDSKTKQQIQNCLHISCINPVVTGGGSALVTSYRASAIATANAEQGATLNNTILDIYMFKPAMAQKMGHKYEGTEPSVLGALIGGFMGNGKGDNSDKAGGTESSGGVGDGICAFV